MGPAEARATDGPGRSRGVDEADRDGEHVIKPITREAGRPLGGGGVAVESEMKPAMTDGVGRHATGTRAAKAARPE